MGLWSWAMSSNIVALTWIVALTLINDLVLLLITIPLFIYLFIFVEKFELSLNWLGK